MHKVINRYCLLAITLFLAGSSWSKQPRTKASPPKKPSVRHHINASLYVRNIQRFEKALHHHTSPNILEARIQGKGRLRWNIDYQYNLRGLLVPDNLHFFQSVSELHIGKTYEQTSWFLGRRILPWNPTEAYWGLARLNGRDGVSPIEPVQEGLIGFHLKHRTKNFIAELFASYLFLPRLNPGQYVEEGRFRSKNEWGAIPPKIMHLKDGKSPIHYTINYPDTGEIVNNIILNGSLGLSLRQLYKVGSMDGSLRAYGIYKPENTTRTVAHNFYKLNSDIGHVSATLNPFINHHALLGIGTSHKMGSFTWNLHLSHNRPRFHTNKQPKDAKFFELHENYFNSTTLSNSLYYQYHSWRAGLHHLSIQQSELYRQRVTALSQIPLWHKAVGFSLEYNRRHSWKGLFDVKYDTMMSNTIIKSEVSYGFANGLSLGARGEIVQSPRQKKINYWSKLRTNDTLQTYLSYRF